MQTLQTASDLKDPTSLTEHDETGIATLRQVLMTLAIIALSAVIVGTGVAFYGLPVLGLTALATVPVVYVVLILLTVGG
jgi:hypothetical protein